MTTINDEKQRVLRYCEGLYRIAEAEGALDQVSTQVYALRDLVQSNEELEAFLKEARIDTEGKREALLQLLSSKVHPTVLNFLLLMIDAGRGNLIPKLLQAFGEIQAHMQGALEGEVRTTIALSTEELDRLHTQLEKIFHKPVRVHQKIDPTILGGLVVRVDKHVIDGSLRRRLDQLRSVILQGAEG